MPVRDLEILYQDNHLLAVNKPAGLPTMGVAPGVDSVFSLARQYIKRRYQKPGNVYLGIMSRLDAASSGIVLLARTSKAAGRLTARFRDREVQKIYWALLAGVPQVTAGELVDWMAKDEARQRMVIGSPATPGAKEARLRYRQLRCLRRGTFVEIELLTGRKHQIRVQFASRGLPVCGEKKYGPGGAFADGIALHARRLAVPHPVGGKLLELVASVSQAWHAEGVRDE